MDVKRNISWGLNPESRPLAGKRPWTTLVVVTKEPSSTHADGWTGRRSPCSMSRGVLVKSGYLNVIFLCRNNRYSYLLAIVSTRKSYLSYVRRSACGFWPFFPCRGFRKRVSYRHRMCATVGTCVSNNAWHKVREDAIRRPSGHVCAAAPGGRGGGAHLARRRTGYCLTDTACVGIWGTASCCAAAAAAAHYYHCRRALPFNRRSVHTIPGSRSRRRCLREAARTETPTGGFSVQGWAAWNAGRARNRWARRTGDDAGGGLIRPHERYPPFMDVVESTREKTRPCLRSKPVVTYL